MPCKKNIKVKCNYCGGEFLTTNYYIKIGWGKFCSNKCSYDSRRISIQVLKNCENCGNEFYARSSYNGKPWGRFCSKKCANSGRFNPLYNKRGDLSPMWRGGKTPIIRHVRTIYKYRQWRDDVFNRDNFTCQECGQWGGQLEAHHRDQSFASIFHKYNIRFSKLRTS